MMLVSSLMHSLYHRLMIGEWLNYYHEKTVEHCEILGRDVLMALRLWSSTLEIDDLRWSKPHLVSP
jgi:hypothetical protein